MILSSRRKSTNIYGQRDPGRLGYVHVQVKLAGGCMRGVIIRFLLNMLGLWLAAALPPGISWARTAGLVWAANAPGAGATCACPAGLD
ncbi:MAG: hypothetical protein CMQ49_05580 [Gammaproteobacteria bacterium]|nr:hypothetical protein [Gammaproteobacteria bacterium]|tara:strand:+ start:234 stop:497 length:264 start_codon:yes stop_codon:yes gene_type:complete